MAQEYKFNRWDKALKSCMAGQAARGGKEAFVTKASNRWSDPMTLNQEAHELPPEKQRAALDFLEEAPPYLKAKLAPMWKSCFVQWHIYDAGLEATEKGEDLATAFKDKLLLADVDTLQALFDDGGLDSGMMAEKWTWKMLEPLPPAGTVEWNEETRTAMIRVAKEERKESVAAYGDERYDKSFWHSCQGIKLLARAPDSSTGVHAKVRGDLLKNKSAGALKLGMKRVALNAAEQALAINDKDEKAWFRKATVLFELGRAEEAQECEAKAGLGPGAPVSSSVALRDDGGARAPAPGSGEPNLDPDLHPVAEAISFCEVGVNSIRAIDLIMHLQAEMPAVTIPQTLVFDNPTLGLACMFMLEMINASTDLYAYRKMVNSLWKATCKALGRDPVRDVIRGKVLSGPRLEEEDALAVLVDLRAAYEEDSWVRTCKAIAQESHYEQRSFLVNLRAKSLRVQREILEAYGFETSEKGVQLLESSVTWASERSAEVADMLRAVRVACYGGATGMYVINYGDDDFVDDSARLQNRSGYLQEDVFGGRANTNSVYRKARKKA